MILLKIKDVKQIMHKLLSETETAFDQFLVAKVEIVTNGTFTLDGHLVKDYYSSEELSELRDAVSNEGRIFSEKMLRYHLVKSLCFQIIRGKKVPKSFSFSFYLSDENVDKFLSSVDTTLTRNDILGLSMNLKYDGSELSVTTGTALSIFTTDKSIDNAWDNMVRKFMDRMSVEYEEL